jgi:hypothetical protein
MMVNTGEAKVFERQMPKLSDRFIDRNIPLFDLF